MTLIFPFKIEKNSILNEKIEAKILTVSEGKAGVSN